jgi:hypothetical protein
MPRDGGGDNKSDLTHVGDILKPSRNSVSASWKTA